MIQTVERVSMCDVCRLVDFDTSKKLVRYCGMCDAWICQLCAGNWGKRIKAAIKRKLEPDYNGLPDYVERIKHELEGTVNRPSSTGL